MEGLDKPAVDASIDDVATFLVATFLLSGAIRLLHSLLRALRLKQEDKSISYLAHVRNAFGGFRAGEGNADYWYTFIIGLFELAGYACLIAMNWWAPIGAWLGLKTLAQWNVWQTDRSRFNLFLIGNLLVITCALVFLAPMVTVTTGR